MNKTNTLKITRISPMSGDSNSMQLPITLEQYNAWQTGNILVQDAFPNLTTDEREFLITGIMPNEWDAMFGTEE